MATKTLFGGDSSYTPFSENESTAPNVYAGVQALRSILKPDYRMRFGFQLLSDLTEKDRQVSWAGIVFQVGILGTKNTYHEGNTKYVEKVVEVEKYLFVLDSYLVNFEVKKSKLLPESYNFLKQLGSLLLRHKDEWATLEIEGHTDKSGDINFNQVLSVERAESAKKVFTRVGIDSKRIITRGFGPSKPIDPNSTELAYARNRRVEIVLNGLKDQSLIRNG